ncbi:hypothetical protein [Pseudoruegeria sp. HB172150]|uniref:hypothetical protein n=1 Tax=Pseudoruegeria sp. HB172150 TaxID=2721164 RepID=UPI001552764A|nr:hypothetical protein [Pseudoruegeria sp. HB172150]
MRVYFRHVFIPVALGAALGGAALAQDSDEELEAVRTKVAEAVEAIQAYSASQREQALEDAREALEELDEALTERQEEMRENWAEMSEAAQIKAGEKLAELNTRRIELAEQMGVLQAGADSAWGELKTGFASAWDKMSDAIDESGVMESE